MYSISNISYVQCTDIESTVQYSVSIARAGHSQAALDSETGRTSAEPATERRLLLLSNHARLLNERLQDRLHKSTHRIRIERDATYNRQLSRLEHSMNAFAE